jgi:hypothetical protein
MFQNLETFRPEIFPPSRYCYKHKTPLILLSGKMQHTFCSDRGLAQHFRFRNSLCRMTEGQPDLETLCFRNKNGQQGKKDARV